MYNYYEQSCKIMYNYDHVQLSCTIMYNHVQLCTIIVRKYYAPSIQYIHLMFFLEHMLGTFVLQVLKETFRKARVTL